MIAWVLLSIVCLWLPMLAYYIVPERYSYKLGRLVFGEDFCDEDEYAEK